MYNVQYRVYRVKKIEIETSIPLSFRIIREGKKSKIKTKRIQALATSLKMLTQT